MIHISRLEMYLDGGTIGIFATIWDDETGYRHISIDQPAITIDYAIGTDTPGEWYYGLRSKGSKPVTDEAFKTRVRDAVRQHIFNETSLLNKI